ncbi:hypothetical protein K5D65_20170 [Pseudomonas cichorii]|nr:hypothetical protein [Pseudomonas cichorii]
MRPLIFSGNNLTYIARYDGVTHLEWNQTTGPVVEIRKAVRAHYLKEQRFLCAYCRMEKKEEHGLTWDVEHILPKSVYPRFLYMPLNLAMVCKECNIAKSDKDVLYRALSPRAELPINSEAYKIVHPHHDKYSDHFEIIVVEGKITHRPKNNTKAKETFFMCDLIRFSYAFGEWEDFNFAIVKTFSDFVELCPKDASKEMIAAFMGTLRFTVNADF